MIVWLVIMIRSLKLVFSSILLILIVFGLNNPVTADQYPTIYVDAPSPIPVSTEFDIIIWVRDIPPGWGLTQFDIDVSFDPDDMEFIDDEFLDPDGVGGWIGDGLIINPGKWRGDAQSGVLWTEDRAWFVLTFHCLRAGPAPITVSSSRTIYLEPLAGGQTVALGAEPVTVTVYQSLGPVGGVTSPTNKLEILTPYIALAGLIAAISTLYVIKRRKD